MIFLKGSVDGSVKLSELDQIMAMATKWCLTAIKWYNSGLMFG